jgi:hypothetical protein
LKWKLFMSCIAWRAAFHISPICLGITLETSDLITRYKSVQQTTIIIHKLNKLLTSLQSESRLLLGQTVRNRTCADLPFSEIFS